MPELFVYLLKINIAISLFYCGYYVLLRKLTFYSLNRFYLLFSILLSGIFPFLSIPSIFSKPEIISYNFQVVEGTIGSLPQIEDTQSTVWLVLMAVYWLLVLFGGLKFLARLISLYKIHMKSSPTFFGGYKFNNLSLEITPFSFFKNTYLNFDKHTEKELYTILQHERVHTKNLHSLDILLIEIWSLFSWFNPISWMLKNTIKVNSEFIADQEVIKQGTSYQHYQKSLLNFAIQTHNIPLTNQFSFISIKSRIIMMNKRRSSRKQLGMYILLIPVIVCSLFIFGVSKAYETSYTVELMVEEPIIVEESLETALTVSIQDSVLDKKIQIAGQKSNKFPVDPIRSDKDALYIIDGVPQEKNYGEIKLKPENTTGIPVLKDKSTTALNGDKGKDGVILITTKKSDEGVSEGKRTVLEGDTAGRKTVKGVDKYDAYTTISTPSIDASLVPSKSIKGFYSISGVDASLMDKKSVRYSSSVTIRSKEQPLIIIEGKEVDLQHLQQLNPDIIESFSVFKDKEAIKKYGDKGENGVIVIELKKNTL